MEVQDRAFVGLAAESTSSKKKNASKKPDVLLIQSTTRSKMQCQGWKKGAIATDFMFHGGRSDLKIKLESLAGTFRECECGLSMGSIRGESNPESFTSTRRQIRQVCLEYKSDVAPTAAK